MRWSLHSVPLFTFNFYLYLCSMNLNRYSRRKSCEVKIGTGFIGGDNPIAVQSMTNSATADVEASVAQVESIADAGAPIVRLTAQGRKEGEALAEIVRRYLDGDLVADGYLDEELAHLARDVGEDFMTVLETNGIHGGRKNLDDGSGHFNRFIVCTCHQIDRYNI